MASGVVQMHREVSHNDRKCVSSSGPQRSHGGYFYDKDQDSSGDAHSYYIQSALCQPVP